MRNMFTMGDGTQALPKYDKDSDRLVLQRLVALGYDDDDDSGSGSALSGLLDAAGTLGSAYVSSQAQPQTTQIPTTTRPAYGAATSPLASGGTFGSTGLLLFGLFALGAVVLFFAFGKG